MAQQSRNSYRKQLIAEFERLFPHPLFRGLQVHGNAGWTPRRLLWVSVIMFCLPGKTLGERFSAARRIVKFLHPKWILPASYNSFVHAQQRWCPLLQERLIRQLRPTEQLPNGLVHPPRQESDPQIAVKEARQTAKAPETPPRYSRRNPCRQTTCGHNPDHREHGVECHPVAFEPWPCERFFQSHRRFDPNSVSAEIRSD